MGIAVLSLGATEAAGQGPIVANELRARELLAVKSATGKSATGKSATGELAADRLASGELSGAELRSMSVGDESANFLVDTILSDLDNPCGLAARPLRGGEGPDELFLAESGAGRILQLSTAHPKDFRPVIVGFPTNGLNKRMAYRVGPLGLVFLTARSKLIVGDSGQADGADLLSVYTLPAGSEILDATARSDSAGPLRNRPGADAGNVNFLSLVKTDDMVYVAVGGDDDQGNMLKAGLQDYRLTTLQPLQSEGTLGGGAPGGIAMISRPRPQFLVVAQIGSFEMPGDSALTYYIPATGEQVMSLPTGLHDIMALAYSPSGQLYAADFAWADESAGGVYRLDDVRRSGRQACRAVRIAAVTRPMALAFTSDGALYVTAFGTGENAKQGKLLRITGNL
ncbi:MAG: hypothetical protein MK171_08035 [Pirellulales bacterium]|nr:hypothetical protein [Pirellulales bacterium]